MRSFFLLSLLVLMILPSALVLTAMGPAALAHGADLQTATFFVA